MLDWLKVGQKVTRRLDNDWSDCPSPNYPEFGKVYTIRSVVDGNQFGINKIGICLMEIINLPMDTEVGIREMTFDYTQFSPVIEKKTDISIFTEILNDVNAGKILEINDA